MMTRKLAVWICLAGVVTAQHEGHQHAMPQVVSAVSMPQARTAPWSDEVLDAIRHLPVQDRGRIKPFQTFVAWELLFIHKQRTVRLPDEQQFGNLAGVTLNATEWALDTILFPLQARHYPVFTVANDAVIRAIGLTIEGKKKRDRYSFAELRPAFAELQRQGQEFSHKEEENRTLLEGQIVYLWRSVMTYQGLEACLDFAQAQFRVDGTEGLARAFRGKPSVRFSEILRVAPTLSTAFKALNDLPERNEAQETEYEAFLRVLGDFQQVARGSGRLKWLPPAPREQLVRARIFDEKQLAQQKELEWLGVDDLLSAGAARPDGPEYSGQIEAIAAMERFVDSLAVPAKQAAASQELLATAKPLADARGEYRAIGLEVTYNKWDMFYKALIVYLLTFLISAAFWLLPKTRWLRHVAFGGMALATVLLVTGIVMRCLILQRPPVLTLYDTILFVAAVASIVVLVIDRLAVQKVAVSVGSFLGALAMFLAFKYEVADGQDSLRPLIAVLDTNFWLATHVTTVTMGYAAAVLAGFIAHVWIFGKLLGWKKGQATEYSTYRNIAKMVYGVICFGLLFSVVGTILGGVWANDSWGRFWGWDPKENGALMIVLWELLILHSRLGGYIRDFGLCMMSVALTCVVIFSWGYVNVMGVGLHSYGFSAGLKMTIFSFWGIEAFVLACGGVLWLLQRAERLAVERAKAEKAELDSAEPAPAE